MINRRASVPCGLCSLNVANEIYQLQQENMKLLSRIREMETEHQELRKQLEVSKAAEEEMRASFKSYEETIAHMEQTIRSLKHDFTSESTRSERLQTKNRELELELTVVKRQLDQYQGIQMENISRKRNEAMQQYRLEYEQRQQAPNYNRTHLGSRGVTECDSTTESACYDTVDLGPIVSHPPVPLTLQSDLQTSRLISSDSEDSDNDSQEDAFECPGCGRGFSVDQSELFLQHTEQCL